jgi:hypothetical protein
MNPWRRNGDMMNVMQPEVLDRPDWLAKHLNASWSQRVHPEIEGLNAPPARLWHLLTPD